MDRESFRAATLYWSQGGNTRKVASAFHHTLRDLRLASELIEIGPDVDVRYADYNLILLGAPSYQFHPPEPVCAFLRRQHRQSVTVAPAAPELSNCFGVVFCTYGGPHTGVNEAVPVLKYMGQFLEHAGVRVVDEWPVVGQFHDPGRQQMNICGRLGDIRGRPNEADLRDVSEKLRGLVLRLQNKVPPGGED
jgi:hypothetical protein